MLISDYSFGRIIIQGKTYTSDVIIFPDRVNSSWWRREGHLLQVADLDEIILSHTGILIVGTGYYGAMNVPEETVEYLRANKIETHVRRTSEAVKLYNEMSSRQPVVAALHLTC